MSKLVANEENIFMREIGKNLNGLREHDEELENLDRVELHKLDMPIMIVKNGADKRSKLINEPLAAIESNFVRSSSSSMKTMDRKNILPNKLSLKSVSKLFFCL